MIFLLGLSIVVFTATIVLLSHIHQKERQRLISALLQHKLGSKVASHVSEKPEEKRARQRPLS